MPVKVRPETTLLVKIGLVADDDLGDGVDGEPVDLLDPSGANVLEGSLVGDVIHLQSVTLLDSQAYCDAIRQSSLV